ncbi:hypothetical protein J5751_03690 [bacterium]|nr:hypothetical protein [bacterium]
MIIDRNSVFIYPKDEWILDVTCYFEILKKINIKLAELLKSHINEYIDESFFEYSTELNRIIPIKKKNIDPNDGILELNNYFDFLLDDYSKLFKDYETTILNTNFIRHKYEHAPHTIKMKECVSGEKSKKIEFVYLKRSKSLGISLGEGLYSIETDDMINIVMRLNNIFRKIKNQFYKSAEKRNYDLNNKFFHSIVNFDDEYFDNQLKKWID